MQSSRFSNQKVDHLKQVLQSQVPEESPPVAEAPPREDSNLKDALDKVGLELATLQDKLQAAEQAAKEEHLRHLAELENTRRRFQKERDELVRYGNEALLRELLGTVDSLELSLAHLSPSEATKPIIDGIQLVLKNLHNTLQRFEVTAIDALKQPFDPHLHESLGQKPTDDVAPHTVIEVLQKGYLYRDRLLRPARVMIAS